MPAPSTAVDFRRSLPPVPPELHQHVHQALDELASSANFGQLMHQSVPRGSESDRSAGSRLLQPRLTRAIEPARLIVTNGTQSAILLLLRRLAGANGVVVAERLSYGPLRALAEVAGVHVLGLDIDEDGILPASFEAACRTATPAALYCNPTVQNPTTATMPIERRIAIAEIARRYGVRIIEDEALGRLHIDAPRPIAMFAPDITWYVMSTTKCLAHGLRLAYLIAPSADAADQMLAPVEHLSYWHPAPLAAAMVTHWVNSGAAQQITQSIARECAAREQVTRDVLGGSGFASKPGSMHVWLALPPSIAPRHFMTLAEQRGVLVRASDLFAVDDQPAPPGVRLSLSTPATMADVRRGVEVVKALLADQT